MTQEEKQLLLSDICARLLYGVKANCCDGQTVDIIAANPNYETLYVRGYGNNYPTHWDKIDCYTPYLRPLSSMTEKEWLKLKEWISIASDTKGEIYFDGFRDISAEDTIKAIDYLISHYFDYRGLIPMGLTLEAPKDMYKTE